MIDKFYLTFAGSFFAALELCQPQRIGILPLDIIIFAVNDGSCGNGETLVNAAETVKTVKFRRFFKKSGINLISEIDNAVVRFFIAFCRFGGFIEQRFHFFNDILRIAYLVDVIKLRH